MAKCATPDEFAGLQNCFPLGGLTIQWAFYRQSPALKHVSVDHGGLYILVTEEFLDRSNIITVLQKMRGKGMTEGVWADGFVDPSGLRGLTHSFLQDSGIQMMSSGSFGSRVN